MSCIRVRPLGSASMLLYLYVCLHRYAESRCALLGCHAELIKVFDSSYGHVWHVEGKEALGNNAVTSVRP